MMFLDYFINELPRIKYIVALGLSSDFISFCKSHSNSASYYEMHYCFLIKPKENGILTS